ncbi:MAG: hypothetical protein A3G23_03910 [Bacteroidetes bacterium RIFCSPLOWO2_12_FULL_37_12]|nr:MAG: hypothetical protein A3G23_03910 [Bacteroidetes bacterium RIFCSPLOWO2_12_FULL_37_12]
MSEIVKSKTPVRGPIKSTGSNFDLSKELLDSEVSKSIWRHEYSDNKRNRALEIVNNVFLHLHPTRVPRHAVNVGYTWGMGGITLYLFIVLTMTGILLMFYYRPTSQYAYLDMKMLMHDVPFGAFIRNMHRWGAHLMVITVMLHMYRVFMTGSYKPPRQFNWVIGVFLLVFTLLLSFTGYLLPWDQLSIWAITVGSNMGRATPLLGHEGPFAQEFQNLVGFGGLPDNDVRFLLLNGTMVGAPTLLRFYVLHCVFFPVLAAVFMAVHFFRIRKDGGISGPPMIEFHKAVGDSNKLKVSIVDHLPKYEYLEGFQRKEGVVLQEIFSEEKEKNVNSGSVGSTASDLLGSALDISKSEDKKEG